MGADGRRKPGATPEAGPRHPGSEQDARGGTSLYRTLKTAEDTGNSITEQAQRESELRIREAQLKADQMLSEARQKARSVVDDAYKQAEKTIAEMQAEVNGLGQESQGLENQLEGLVRDLQRLASDSLDKVEKVKARPKASTAAILSRAASVKVNRPDPSPETDSAMFGKLHFQFFRGGRGRRFCCLRGW